MNIEQSIREIFGNKAFERPIFYANPGGLRFGLSEGGYWLHQYQLACKKAHEICSSIFDDEIVICIRIVGRESLLSVLSCLKELRDLDLYPSTLKEHWKEKSKNEPEWALGGDEYWHTVAFRVPKEKLEKLLWFILACSPGIGSCLSAQYYLFNFNKAVEVWPYDDAYMDVVGPNHELLTELYSKFSRYLLDDDKETMDATFADKP